MKQKIGLFLVVILVLVQVLSIKHMAEHAFCKHSHNGKDCEISLVFEQAKDKSSTNKILPSPLLFSILKNESYSIVIQELFSVNESSPRAPPYTSFV